MHAIDHNEKVQSKPWSFFNKNSPHHTRHNVDVICPHDMLQELDVEPFCCGDVVAWLGPIGPNID